METADKEPIHHYIVPINGLISELIELPDNCGVCVEVSQNICNRVLFLNKSALDFETFLRAWSKCLNQGQSILNENKRYLAICVRSHSIEEECLLLLEKYRIADYFFDGSSFPDVFHLRSHKLERAKFAYRISEYEGTDNLLLNPELYDWILIDSFTGANLLETPLYEWSKKNGIQICVKTPELNGLKYNREFFEKLEKYKNISLLVPLSHVA